ncbi:MAG: hypothetical protein ABIJ47_11125 [Candidatus Bathyarchaeota archaeon]
MSRAYVRVYEAVITVLSSFLAVSSFFSTSLYRVISEGIVDALRSLNVLTTSTQSITQYAPIMLSTLVFLVVVYDYAVGKPESMIDIYEINLVLITPELLSHSKLNWFNLIQKAQIIEPTRSPIYVFFTGVVVLVGYISLLFTARARETYSELESRGISPVQLNKIFLQQNQVSIAFALASALVSSILFLALPGVKTALYPFIMSVDYSYLVLGVAAAVIISVGVAVYFTEQGEKTTDNAATLE